MPAATNKLSVAHVNLARGFTGMERQTELLIRELANLGVKQALVCRDDSPLPSHLDGVKNIKVYRIRGMSDPRLIGHFRLGSRYSIIHAHESRAMQWSLVHYLMYGTPYVLSLRNEKLEADNFVNRAVFHNAAYIVAVSKVIKANFEKAYSRSSQLICDCSSRFSANEEIVQRFRNAMKNRFVVGCVGPLINREKGQSVLIDAAKILKNKLPELVVVFVGSGDDGGLLKAHAQGMPNVKFVGFRRNVIDYIAFFDVFAYPVNQEGVGSIILDVMEQGVPVIASNVGVIPDLVKHGQTGLLMKPGDAETLADHILTLKRNPSFRKNLVHNGYEEVELHSSAAMAADYYRLYINILNGVRDI